MSDLKNRLQALEALEWRGEVDIPLPSRSIIEFSQLCRVPNVSIKALAEKAEQEPGIMAELLRHVNSSLIGMRTKIVDIRRAIGILGLANSASIVLTNALLKSMESVESPLLPSQVFRRDSIERAVFARVLARYFPQCPMSAYTAGLLQDVMLPTLTRQYESDYREYLGSTDYQNLEEFERLRFGWTHAELAARLLHRWDFHPSIVAAVIDHHLSPESLLADDLTQSPVMTSAISALLVDTLNQTPDGITRLVDLQKLHPGFRLLDIAGEVDTEMRTMFPSLRNPTSLTVRIQEGMLSQLEIRRARQVASGRQFGNYILQEKLAESTMGAIYKARHAMMRRPTAIKILRVDKMTARSIAQFEQEVQITSRLRSPHTISIFDYGITPDDLFYYAMEYIDGCTLKSLVEHHGPLPEARVLLILRQACSSLAEAHRFGLIHRDIKPENIMVSHLLGNGDHVTVLDFGLAKLNDSTPADATHDDGLIVGTPLYMSPEAANCSRKLDARSDIYSLAAVGYYLLSGRPVFEGKRVLEILRQHMEDPPIPLTRLLGDAVSEATCQLIMKCLAKKPQDRIQSAAELANELTRLQEGQPWTILDSDDWWQQRIEPAGSNEETHDETSATLIGE